MLTFVAKTLVCSDCGAEFIWDASEQEWYAVMGFNAPRRCPACREARREAKLQRLHPCTEIICAECGTRELVPFIPREGRPVYCRECFERRRERERVDR